jgi:hypothetical protein
MSKHILTMGVTGGDGGDDASGAWVNLPALPSR